MMQDLERIGNALYGPRWKAEMSRDLQLSDPRRIREWLTGYPRIPDRIWAHLEVMLRERHDEIFEILSLTPP